MEANALRQHIYDVTEVEKFYKDYYFAGKDPDKLKEFLKNLDMDMVLKNHLLIKEKKETIPEIYEDYFFFDLTDNDSIIFQKHERYNPDIEHIHTLF